MADDGYKTMRVPESAWKIAQEAKGDDETWGEYLLRCADSPRVEMSEDELDTFVRSRIESMIVDEALRR